MKVFLVVIIFVIIAMSAGMFLLLGGRGEEGGPSFGWLSTAPTGTEVRVEPVAERSLVETIPAPGVIEPNTKIEISSQVVAEITALPFREGEEVQKGDIVVQLDDRELKARLDAAKASHASAQANLASTKASRARTAAQLNEQLTRRKGLLDILEFAKRDLARKQALYDSGDIAMSELDQSLERVTDLESNVAATDTMISAAESSLAQADAQILQAEAGVKQAEADIKLAEESLRNTTIVSPINGQVVQLNAEVGETVVTGTMNNAGTIIMTIADLSRMKMIARVDESDIVPVEVGQTADVVIRGHEEPFDGVVDKISLQRSSASDGTGYFETEILLRLDGRAVKSGHTANALIEVREHTGLSVPSQSVVDREIDALPVEIVNQNPLIDRNKRAVRVVYRVIDGKAVVTPVRVGPSDTTHTLILDGLESGELVVTGPYKVLDAIKHNQQVRALELEALPTSENLPATADARPSS